MRDTRSPLLAPLFAAVLLGGCRSAGTEPAAVAARPAGDAPRIQEIATAPPAKPGDLRLPDPASLMPRSEVRGAFQRTPASKAGRFDARWSRKGDGWVLEIEGLRRSHYAIDAEGNVVVTRDEDLTERVAVDYTPGVIVLPRAADAAVDREVAMVVRHLHNGSERDRGVCRYSVLPMGNRDVATPAGGYAATLFRVRRSIDLRLADATVDAVTAWSSGLGIVAEHVERDVRPLGVFRSQSRYTLERSE